MTKNRFSFRQSSVKFLQIIVVLVMTSSLALAGIVKGIVTDFQSGEPLTGANVILR